MSEFDDLLDEMLREASNQQTPAGFRERLSAAVHNEVIKKSAKDSTWRGLAAVLAIGAVSVATWTLVGGRGGRLLATHPMPGALQRVATPPSGEFRGLHGPRDDRKKEQKSSFQKSVRSRLPSRERPILIAPVVIVPLAIDPIDIAIISLDDPAMKGSTI